MIVDAAITASKLADGSVTQNKIGTGEVVSGNIADGAISSVKLANSSVTALKIADGAVISSKFQDGSVTESKIASGAVIQSKLADNVVSQFKISDGAVVTSKISDGAVTTAKILDGSVTTSKILDGSITNSKLAAGVGFQSPMTTQGDLIVGGASGSATRLGRGSADQVLSSNGTSLVWIDPQWGQQGGEYFLTTTNQATSTIATVSIPTGKVSFLSVTVSARRTAGSGDEADSCCFVLTTKARNQSGTVSISSVHSNEWKDVTSWNANLEVSGSSVLVRVTGASLTTIDWVALVEQQTI